MERAGKVEFVKGRIKLKLYSPLGDYRHNKCSYGVSANVVYLKTKPRIKRLPE